MIEENFGEARATIGVFERISKAKLNLEKSAIVMMDESPPPPWIFLIGCKVAQPGEVYKYLGSPIGVHVSTTMEAEFLLGKVMKRVSHWANRLRRCRVGWFFCAVSLGCSQCFT